MLQLQLAAGKRARRACMATWCVAVASVPRRVAEVVMLRGAAGGGADPSSALPIGSDLDMGTPLVRQRRGKHARLERARTAGHARA